MNEAAMNMLRSLLLEFEEYVAYEWNASKSSARELELLQICERIPRQYNSVIALQK